MSIFLFLFAVCHDAFDAWILSDVIFQSKLFIYSHFFFCLLPVICYLTGAMDENGMTLQAANASNGVFRECMIIENELSDMVIGHI